MDNIEETLIKAEEQIDELVLEPAEAFYKSTLNFQEKQVTLDALKFYLENPGTYYTPNSVFKRCKGDMYRTVKGRRLNAESWSRKSLTCMRRMGVPINTKKGMVGLAVSQEDIDQLYSRYILQIRGLGNTLKGLVKNKGSIDEIISQLEALERATAKDIINNVTEAVKEIGELNENEH